MNLREKAKLFYLSLRGPSHFSLISDDCWGGEVYRELKLKYNTPTIGLWIEPNSYIDFIANIGRLGWAELDFLKQKNAYPIATTAHAKIHFLHYTDEEEAKEKFTNRSERMSDRLFFKVDFGKPGYSEKEIKHWNQLRLNNSVAFCKTRELALATHNGVHVDNWDENGARLFNKTRKCFNHLSWLKTGHISCSWNYRILNWLILDPYSIRKLRRRLTTSH